MGRIEWLPIEDLPEEMKDGRDVLAWGRDGAVVVYWVESSGLGAVSHWVSESGFIERPTHFAEINAPDQILRGSE